MSDDNSADSTVCDYQVTFRPGSEEYKAQHLETVIEDLPFVADVEKDCGGSDDGDE